MLRLNQTGRHACGGRSSACVVRRHCCVGVDLYVRRVVDSSRSCDVEVVVDLTLVCVEVCLVAHVV